MFETFVAKLQQLGYRVHRQIAFAPDYGVPQRRSRLVLLASRLGEFELESPTHAPSQYTTVARAIEALLELSAGGIDNHDPLHRSSRLSELNLKRIRAPNAGGNCRDWSDELICDCHNTATRKGYASVYGRLE